MRSYSSLVCVALLASMPAMVGVAMAADPGPPDRDPLMHDPPLQLPTAPAPEAVAAQALPTGAKAGGPRTIDGIGAAVDPARLAGLRGGDDSVTSNILTDGTVSDNQAENIVSGSNTIAGGAFGNASGVSSVIQNSGANVLIQNAMIVNVQFTDPGP